MEIWKEVRPGLEVSSLGRVRQILSGHKDSDGYLVLSGGKRGKPVTRVHHLVAEAFLGKRPAGSVVRHLNDDPLDNRAENLAYGSRRDNYADARRNGLVNPQSPERLARLKEIAHMGGKWWRGRKRQGERGKAVRD